VTLPVNTRRSLQVTTSGYADRYVRHVNSLANTAVVNAGSSALLKNDATYTIRPGLAGTGCYSFESVNHPGQYLRQANSRVQSSPNDGSELMRADATWCARTGLTASAVSLESYNFPGSYLRHYNSEVWLSSGADETAYNPDELGSRQHLEHRGALGTLASLAIERRDRSPVPARAAGVAPQWERPVSWASAPCSASRSRRCRHERRHVHGPVRIGDGSGTAYPPPRPAVIISPVRRRPVSAGASSVAGTCTLVIQTSKINITYSSSAAPSRGRPTPEMPLRVEYALTPRGRDLVARLPLAWWIAVHADEIVYGTADSARPAARAARNTAVSRLDPTA
jgi:Alpha-L-arabinofuranosidase B (ABFB) domain